MIWLVLVAAALGGFFAGFAAAFVVLDHLLGGRGPVVSLSPEHRRALDGPPW